MLRSRRDRREACPMAGCRARKVPVQAGVAGENRCESRCGPRAARGGARSWLDNPGPSTPPASASFAGSGSSEFVPVSAPSLLQPLRAYAVITWGRAVAPATPWAPLHARRALFRGGRLAHGVWPEIACQRLSWLGRNWNLFHSQVDSESTKQLFRSWNNSGTGTPWNVSGKHPTPSVGAATPCNVAASRPGGSLRV